MGVFESSLNVLPRLDVDKDTWKVYQELYKLKIRPQENKKFDVASYLNSLAKPVIEIGGPTDGGFVTVDIERLNQFFTSNIAAPDQHWSTNQITGTWRDRISNVGPVNFRADGRHLPLAAESTGGILISAMLNDQKLNEDIIKEARRVLVQGGILVLENNNPQDVLFALNNGFEPVIWKRKSIRDVFAPFSYMAFKKISDSD